MRKPMFPVIHFELPVSDGRRARRFYESVFGWETADVGPEAGDFVLAFTTDTNPDNRMPKNVGAVNGGFYKKTKPNEHTRITILVDDIRDAVARVKAAGGTFLPGAQGELSEIPGVGVFATFTDPEGNAVQVYEDRSPNPTPEQRALLGETGQTSGARK